MAKFKSGALGTILKDFDNQTMEKVDKAVRIAAIGTLGAIIEQTPVDEGRARGNWFLTVGKPSVRATDKKDKNKGSSYVANRIGNILKKKHYLTNNLPYIKSLEYGVHEAATVKSHSVKAHTRKVKGKSVSISSHTRSGHGRAAYRTKAHRMVRDNIKHWGRRLKAAYKGLS